MRPSPRGSICKAISVRIVSHWIKTYRLCSKFAVLSRYLLSLKLGPQTSTRFPVRREKAESSSDTKGMVTMWALAGSILGSPAFTANDEKLLRNFEGSFGIEIHDGKRIITAILSSSLLDIKLQSVCQNRCEGVDDGAYNLQNDYVSCEMGFTKWRPSGNAH